MKTTSLSIWNNHGLQHRSNNICEGSFLKTILCQIKLFVGFHNRLNHRIERSHPNIWSFIKCLQGEESRFRHMRIQLNAAAQGRPKTAATTAIQQRIDTLNERYLNNEIILQVLLDGLSTVMVKQHR
ncbi:unnamed protein product [Rotaria sordida]|uniref:Uncharacterized protein n=1 Tax=Rotaria sordida TaxID=392033 RepID=A0A814QL69_9BILA|nr:unnamed protein product [Rotaria sordida]CAF1064840.1 unnamed protein product [Rotaria sordida]CAF1121303.1 unnamed protein product [Rotaria sordida]CAF1121707.1 unnamed protein product [Rotaria sordida]CAF3874871.1 unnamed protein product [Rotaria sordida]